MNDVLYSTGQIQTSYFSSFILLWLTIFNIEDYEQKHVSDHGGLRPYLLHGFVSIEGEKSSGSLGGQCHRYFSVTTFSRLSRKVTY